MNYNYLNRKNLSLTDVLTFVRQEVRLEWIQSKELISAQKAK